MKAHKKLTDNMMAVLELLAAEGDILIENVSRAQSNRLFREGWIEQAKDDAGNLTPHWRITDKALSALGEPSQGEMRKAAEDMVLKALREGTRPTEQMKALTPRVRRMAQHLFDTYGDWEWQTQETPDIDDEAGEALCENHHCDFPRAEGDTLCTAHAEVRAIEEAGKDEIVHKGFTRGALQEAIEAISDPNDWKGPLRGKVALKDLEVTIAAAEFFTGTGLSVEGALETSGVTVTGLGYRMGPCGDH